MYLASIASAGASDQSGSVWAAFSFRNKDSFNRTADSGYDSALLAVYEELEISQSMRFGSKLFGAEAPSDLEYGFSDDEADQLLDLIARRATHRAPSWSRMR